MFVYIQRERIHIQKMDSVTDFPSDILQPFQFEPVLTATEIQAKISSWY